VKISTGRAGIFFPRPETTLPIELKREMFSVLSAEMGHRIKKRGLAEKNILDDFQSWRKSRRETGR
jgi:hypothetical protein